MTQFDADAYEDLYEHAPCGYLTLELGGSIDRVNATFLAWTGHEAKDLVGRKFQSLLSVAGKIYFETHFAPLLQLQGTFNEVAFDLVAKDGSHIPVLINAAKRAYVTNKATSIWMTVFNATDRRHYERELLTARRAVDMANDELRATNERLDRANHELQAYYDALPVGIFRADRAGRMIQASRVFCTLFGVDEPEKWPDVLPSADQIAIADDWHDKVRNSQPFARRFQIAEDGNPTRHLEMKAVPINGNEGGAWAFVGIVEDVTDQVHAEVQKRQIDHDAAIRKLTGGLAHNLNNFLTIIVGNLELLEDDPADRLVLASILRNGLEASERAASLVRRLLIYSGQGFARPSLTRIDQCLGNIANDLSGQIGHAHRLICDLGSPHAEVSIDPAMLREAVEELVANAVNAMPAGGEIRLSSTLERRENDAEGQLIVIAVYDAGSGMDEATMAEAREPFFTRQDVGQGLGLGLSLVDGIARIAGGELKLYSATGKGTKVELRLPA